MLEMAARGAQVLVALGGAYLLALWFVLIVWTYRDIEARSNSVFTQIFSTLLVVLFFIPGVLLYLLLRPKETVDEAFQRSLEEEYLLQDLEELNHCPSCHRTVEDGFVICPSCQGQLRESCSGCGRLVDLKWPVCPYCTTPRKERAELGERVEPPAPRYIAADARTRRSAGKAVAATEAVPLAGAGASAGVGAGDTARRALQPVVRPLDRFRPRPVAERGNGTVTAAGDELVRSLEAREGVTSLAAPARSQTETRSNGDGGSVTTPASDGSSSG